MSRELGDPNPNLSDRSAYLSREMTTWSWRALKDLFEGNEEFALYMREADHQAVFFYAHGRCWLMTRAPTSEFSSALPELVEDWIGASAPKENGAEPVLMHREELPKEVKAMVDHVEVVEPEHPYETFERVTDERYHHDDREPLAYAYDGTILVAVGYREEIVSHWEEATNYTVSRTPRGDDDGE